MEIEKASISEPNKESNNESKFTFKKLLKILAGLLIVFIVKDCVKDFTSIYGKYEIQFNEHVKYYAESFGEGGYIEVNKDGNIHYHNNHSGISNNSSPFDFDGTFTRNGNILQIDWNDGGLPSELHIKTTGLWEHSIDIGTTHYVK